MAMRAASFPRPFALMLSLIMVRRRPSYSYSAQKGVLRGLHFQIPPRAQGKLIRCTRGGSILDVSVDIRVGSPTYVLIPAQAAHHNEMMSPAVTE